MVVEDALQSDLFVAGDRTDAGFKAWATPVDETIARINEERDRGAKIRLALMLARARSDIARTRTLILRTI